MRRVLFIATSLLLVLPASAQMRGGGRGAPGVRPALASHRGMVANRGAFGHPGFSGVGFATGFGGRFGRSSRGRFRHHHHRFFENTWGYGYWGYPIGGYYDPWFGEYSVDESDYAPNANLAYESAPSNQQARLEQSLDSIEDRLNNLISRLQSPRPAPTQSQAAPPEKPEPSSEATLVFRDGHSETIENYAIVGHTVWVFNEQRARKIPLAQINTEATEQANQLRGIDMHLPKA